MSSLQPVFLLGIRGQSQPSIGVSSFAKGLISVPVVCCYGASPLLGRLYLCWCWWEGVWIVRVALVLGKLLGNGTLATDEVFSSGKFALR